MRRVVWLVVVCALILPSLGCFCCALDVSRLAPTHDAGCVEQTDSARVTPVADPESRFSARLEAARQVTDPMQKNRVMAKLAGDAAEAGLGELVKQCVITISDPLLRNTNAANCALKLAKAGQEPAALELARLMSDPLQRNEVLAKVAMGEEGP
jgi:hypothetical protein